MRLLLVGRISIRDASVCVVGPLRPTLSRTPLARGFRTQKQTSRHRKSVAALTIIVLVVLVVVVVVAVVVVAVAAVVVIHNYHLRGLL